MRRPRKSETAGTPAACPVCTLPGPKPSEVFWKATWPVWTCPSCRSSFVWPLPTSEDLKLVYGWKQYTLGIYENLPITQRRRLRNWNDLLDFAEKVIPSSSRSALDVGCSLGYFLEIANARGWKVSGIEWDEETAARARSRTGLPVATGGALEALPTAGMVDLVVLSHCLEHMPDPKAVFEEAARHLAPGGLMIVRVPDAGCKVARTEGTDWSWFCPPIHLFYFEPVSIGALAVQAGLQIVEVRQLRGDSHLWIVERALAVIRRIQNNGGRRLQPPGSGPTGPAPEAPRWIFAIVELADAIPPALIGRSELNSQEAQVLLRRP